MIQHFSKGIPAFLFLLFSTAFLLGAGNQEGDRFSEYRQLYTENSPSAQAPMAFPAISGEPASGMSVPGFSASAAPTLNVIARIVELPHENVIGRLEILAVIPDGYKIYSLTQQSGGPFPTKIHLPAEIRLQGEIQPSPAPHAAKDPETWGEIVIESHSKSVKWLVDFVWTDPAVIPAQLTGSVEAQMCDANSCLPPKKFPFTLPVSSASNRASAGTMQPALKVAEFPPIENGGSDVSDIINETDLSNTANLADSGNNVPASVTNETNSISVPSNQVPAAQVPVSSTEVQLPEFLRVQEETNSGDAEPCVTPIVPGTPVETEPQAPAEEEPLVWSESGEGVNYSLAIILVMAYLGGLILNLMPCVLPVIAPKLHSFARQSGESRGRIFMLNVSYTLGLLTVLWLLAALSRIGDLLGFVRTQIPVTAAYLPNLGNMGWGQQFTYPGFVIFMISLVFVMGLSFLGVWEIPIPGMISSGSLGKMQRKEGFLGAYCMGILTTLLATPCVGPYLGPVFGWVMTQPIWMSFLTFTVIGLGLGTPYLTIGAFPVLIRFLPKPGEWMETLKEVMGFFFLGTVVWLFYCLPGRFFVPTLGLLTVMWFACWLIGKTTLSGASREAVWTAWCVGILVSVAAGVGLFSLDLTPSGQESKEIATSQADSETSPDVIPWETFSEAKIQEALVENKVVFIDFTARWCATCQTNGKFVINTPEIATFIRENGIQPLLADWSEPSVEIESYLRKMNRHSIPLIVIWIPGETQPILIDGLVTKGKLLKALDFAIQKRQ